MNEHHFGKILAHAPYTLNPASSNGHTREFALETLRDDLIRMESLPGNYYNFHPGSHVGGGVQTGIDLISDALNQILFPNQSTIVLLETMAGKGSEIGGSFQELGGLSTVLSSRRSWESAWTPATSATADTISPAA